MTRDSFRQALNRALQESANVNGICCGGARYQLRDTLGVGEISKVYLACRVASLPLVVTIKISSQAVAKASYAREAQVLKELHDLDRDGVGAYFSRLLPEVIALGAVEGMEDQQGLVLTHPSGFWGSLAALSESFAMGIDPRHAVWIWRRMLEVLGFVHHHGWTHGDLRPEHALVHPQNHGVRIIGWTSARKSTGPKAKAADLLRSARVIQVLLSGASGSGDLPGGVPTGLAQLVNKTATDESFCVSHGAEELDAMLQAEAQKAFGPPLFVPLIV